MASDSKPEVTEISHMGTASGRPSFGSRVVAHFKRWWWVHLIILIVVILVIVLPVVYVAYPKIAQNLVNKSTLSVSKMVISDPSPTSFILNQTNVIGTNSSFHPTFYSFAAAISLAGGAAFSQVQVPQFRSHNDVNVPIDQRVNVTDQTAFAEFCKAVILSEEFEMNVYGKPNMKEGGLPTEGVTYNKTTTMKGLNKLSGFDLIDLSIDTSTSSGVNGKGTVYLPNPSVISIAVGNLTLNLSVNNTAIGYAYIDDLVIRPGNNTVAMTAAISELTVVGLLGGYPNYVIPVDITGNSSVYDGQELPYIAEALGSLTLTTQLNVTQALGSSSL
ncbi:hypothetical protein BO70DRAFT_360560 [Aspergillus heteromorphus CBS 117.55]|uniref:Uncharacterized protein n=1 Tax=Aspergillus heteromorphus CBS 117.55 TaxID=1448321 RepID=A0A317WRQ1_9EURO|nr:uncharacterized protein BO70DRAFT_360560 [Aspergillus heteromorphus CBS 117.55]PWY86850.1 hypothetical protein BO70DRAFT_360560 [Aspergillus heteromorphus CBS 117.55]